MIGWAPFLLTGVAGALLVVAVLDADSGFHASAYVSGDTVGTWLHNSLNASIQWLSHLGVQDWVLVGISAFLLAWGWVRAVAFVRLGTIQIADLSCDDDKLAPAAARAVLQQALGDHGLLPPSGVPSGSPSVASIADAISKAPIPQASWLGSLIGLIPWPPSSTGFQLSGNLHRTGAAENARVCFAYELVCTGPRPRVHLGKAEGPDPAAAITHASLDIYRTIAEMAPHIYPTWARWHSPEAQVIYRHALAIERDKRYEEAHRRYMDACAADPDNMISRLRAANCLERVASGTKDPARRLERRVEALAAYTSIRIRRPSIFEARFRASVLMSVLASEPSETLAHSDLLRATLARFERASSKAVDPHDSRRDALARPPADRSLNARLEAAALIEARRARRQLRPMHTLLHEYRLRHRFEPTGRERRQLRKALGVSQMAQNARSERRRLLEPTDAPHRAQRAASQARQFRWQMLVKWHYLACRWHVAGWPAHYNAACFYALLPRAEEWHSRPVGTRLRRRALRHLELALDQADGALDCAYVRDEDPDLESLRRHNHQRFTNVLACVCPDELVIHYKAAQASETWTLRAWGPATKTESGQASAGLSPVRTREGEVTFRVRIFDENCGLCFRVLPHSPTGWQLIPATLFTTEIWVLADDEDPAILDVDDQPVMGVTLVAANESPAPPRLRAHGHHSAGRGRRRGR
ncbi:MAG TPA: hypothetical protein VHW96_13070 [Solirubrobacteraceae bacterium]|nr:hypothetical protein [Solirubrobacteraceae bacterium]